MSTRVLRFDGGRSDARRPIFLMTGCGGASGGKRGESEAVGERPVPGVPGERVVTVPTVMARGGCGRPRAGRRRCWALIHPAEHLGQLWLAHRRHRVRNYCARPALG
jgi:hypothetical protein